MSQRSCKCVFPLSKSVLNCLLLAAIVIGVSSLVGVWYQAATAEAAPSAPGAATSPGTVPAAATVNAPSAAEATPQPPTSESAGSAAQAVSQAATQTVSQPSASERADAAQPLANALTDDPNAFPELPRAIAEAMQDRRYAEAIEAIDAHLDSQPPQSDYLTYLKGRTLYLEQKYDDAIALFAEAEKQFAKSPWAHWLRFGRALSLAKKGDFAAAEAIYRNEAQRLLSQGRKDELAGIYLEFADRLFDPPNPVEEKPDYAKARQFYEKARELGPSEQLFARIVFQIGRCAQLSGDWTTAANTYQEFVGRYPNDERCVAAHLYWGESLLAAGQAVQARRVWEDMLTQYQDRPCPETATAAFCLAETRGLPNPPSDEDLSLGLAYLRQFLERFPKDERFGQAYLMMATANISRQHWDDAAKVLEEFLADPRSEQSRERANALDLLAGIYRHQKQFSQAIELWRKFVQQYPTHPSWSEAQSQIIDAEFEAAYEEFLNEKDEAARKAWEAFLAAHPLDSRAPQILFYFGQMAARQKAWDAAITAWRQLAEKYPGDQWGQRAQLAIAQTYEQHLRDPEKALAEYRKVRGPLAPQAVMAIARLTTKTLTVETPRVFRSDETPKVRLVTRNVDRVTVSVYRLDPESYFRKIHTLEGVEQLDVALIDPDASFEFTIPDYKAYVQLESFIPIEIAGGKKAGAVAVIISSKTLEATTLVPQSDLDIIVKSARNETLVFAQNMRTGEPWPGATVLLADKTGAIHEAKTDGQGVSRIELPPEVTDADLRVLVLAEGHLASNGVDLQGLPPPTALTDRGLIYSDRPVYRAGQIVNLRAIIRLASAAKKVSAIEGPSPTKEAAADSARSTANAAAAGDEPATPTATEASVTAGAGTSGEASVGQQTADKLPERYRTPEGERFTLQVLDAENRVVRTLDGTLDRFGCLHDQFLLPEQAALGEYKIVATVAEKTFTGGFRVEAFQIQPITLRIDVPRRVYYRGETIEGTIHAAYTYGAPLAGVAMRYQFGDQPAASVVSDESGQVKFRLETRDFAEAQVIPLLVSIPGRNFQVAENFVLATQGFATTLSTRRDVFLPGESFEISVETRDAAGEPTAQKLTLKVLRRMRTGRTLSERVVQEIPLQTDPQGLAYPVIHIDEGGEYLVRVEGEDRFGHPIWAQKTVRISDDKDADRLHILADQHTFRVGDTAKIRVHWKDEPALALMCFQGAGIIDHKLVKLQKGDNKVVVPITAELAPEFELSISLMRDVREIEPTRPAKAEQGGAAEIAEEEGAASEPIKRRFYEAVSPFTVQRDLKVQLVWKAKEQKEAAESPASVPPGSELEVTVITTDGQGKAVPAQLSLALVESALLKEFGSGPTLASLFQGESRRGQIRTASSILFAYHPATRPIDRLLLAEEERAELDAEEAAAREALGRIPASTVTETQADISAQQRGQSTFGLGGGMGGQPAAPPMSQPGLVPGESETVEQLAEAGADAIAEGQSRRRSGAAGGKGEAKNGSRDKAPDESLALEDSKRQRSDSYGFYGKRAEKQADGASFIPPTPANLQQAVAERRQNFLVVDTQGRLQYLESARLGLGEVTALANRLQSQGSLLLPEGSPHETAFWDPAVETGPDGKATLTVTVPDRSTAWKFLAKGVTIESLVGETESDFQVKKDLFLEGRFPLALQEGDEVRLPITVHNDQVEQGMFQVTMQASIGPRMIRESKTVTVTQKGPITVEFPFQANIPEEVQKAIREAENPQQLQQALRSTVEWEISLFDEKSDTPVDILRQSAMLRPRGVMEFVTQGGSATSDTTAWLELPQDDTAPWLVEVFLGPTMEGSLADVLFGSGGIPLPCGDLSTPLERTTSDLMAALALRDYLRTVKQPGGVPATVLDSKIHAAITSLVSAQNSDGGWSWSGGKAKANSGPASSGVSRPEASARAFWALHSAQQAGYVIPQATLDAAVGYLEQAMAQAPADDTESRAILLHVLALVQRADFAMVNRLYRERQSLTLAGKLYFALALAAMDRRPMAEEILKLVDLKNLENLSPVQQSRTGRFSPAEAHALFALVLQVVSPQAPQVREAVDWLLAHRVGHRWLPDWATGPAALALSQWFAKNQFAAERYRLTVFVNDFQLGQWEFDQDAPSRSVLVPLKFLVGKRERIQLRLEGRGRYTYQCLARRFVSPEKARSGYYRYSLRAAPQEVEGREIPRGYTGAGNLGAIPKPSWGLPINFVTQLPVGKQAILELVAIPNPTDSGFATSQFVLTVPLPAGTTVVPNSVTGPYERVEIRPGELVVYAIRRPSDAISLTARLAGAIPGSYGLGPAILRDANNPAAYSVINLTRPQSTASPALEVLAEGATSKDPYQLSPLELIEFGNWAYSKKDWKKAEQYFAQLFNNSNWDVTDETIKQLAPRMIDIYLELDQPNQVVHYFEILKVKWPDYEVPFDKILRIAGCYERLGEYERSFLIFRATMETSFANDSNTAGFLDDQGELLRSVRVMNRLLAEYPPEPYAAAARYALAQRVYAKAADAASDHRLREAKVTRIHLISTAWAMLDRFLTTFPEDPAADQAAFAAANAQLDMELYRQAAEAAARYAQRYPKSPLLDSFWYLIGYCNYALGQHDQAIEMCRKVADYTQEDPVTRQPRPSRNKTQALYILGQIYHSLNQPVQAIQYYLLVASQFSDAKEAIDYFKRKAIEWPEITTAKPGQPVQVSLQFRNIGRCELKVHRIDLLKFALLKRDFAGILGINLAGIRPEHEEQITLGDGQDYRDRQTTIKLPFSKEGAYLVVCRGDELYTSGLILITPLVLEVQEDAQSGRVRATVKDAQDHYVNHALVKVIGSRNDEFVTGYTDLRGVFVADGIQGRVTVIARLAEDQYAFYRGKTELGRPPEIPMGGAAAPAQQAEPAAPQGKPQARGEDRRELLRGLQESNTMLQQQQIENLRQIYKQQRKGVEASQAF